MKIDKNCDPNIGPRLSVEMLTACLKELKRFDVLDIIRESEEENGLPVPAQVSVPSSQGP
jgi:hypothetical protein